jgi:hypothetical protein
MSKLKKVNKPEINFIINPRQDPNSRPSVWESDAMAIVSGCQGKY